jgi:2-oxoglutarate ferredoxin oxidoreductase subunit beta
MKETKIFERPKSMSDVPTHYCPGCTHGIAHRLVAEVIDELGIQKKTFGVAPWGAPCFSTTTSTPTCTRPPTAGSGGRLGGEAHPSRHGGVHLSGGRRPGFHRMAEIVHAANRENSSRWSSSTTPSTA